MPQWMIDLGVIGGFTTFLCMAIIVFLFFIYAPIAYLIEKHTQRRKAARFFKNVEEFRRDFENPGK